MGIVKKHLEKEENNHTGKFCIKCGVELKESELEYNKNFGVLPLCENHRIEWEKLQEKD